MPKPAATVPTPTAAPEAIALAREIHARINAISMREDVTVARRTLELGLAGVNLKPAVQAGLPPEIVAFAATMARAEWVWDFTDRKQGLADGAAGGRFILPRFLESTWQGPSPSYPFPAGSRFVMVDLHVNEGYGYAFEPAPGGPIEYVFARAAEEGEPVRVAPALEGYFRKGLESGFAWYWQLDSEESKYAAARLREPAPLRPTVEVTIHEARTIDRRTLRSKTLSERVSPPTAKAVLKGLGVSPPRGTGDALYAALAETVDLLATRPDDEVLRLLEADPKTSKRVLQEAVPTAANLRRALDVLTLGPSQPDDLVELSLSLKSLGPIPELVLRHRGLIMQILAGRDGSPIPERLGETEFWDTTSRYGQEALAHAAVVPVLPRLPYVPELFGAKLTLVADASMVPGVAAGETWTASPVLSP